MKRSSAFAPFRSPRAYAAHALSQKYCSAGSSYGSSFDDLGDELLQVRILMLRLRRRRSSAFSASSRTSGAVSLICSRSFSRSVASRSYSSFFAFFARSTSWMFFFTFAYFGFVTSSSSSLSARTFTVPTCCLTMICLMTIGLIDAESAR